MNDICDKLPKTLSKSDFNNDYNLFLSAAYTVYKKVFIDNNITFKGAPIQTNRAINCDLRYIGFEHVTTKDTGGYHKDYRTYNEKRIERVPWLKHLITGAECSGVCDGYRVFSEIKHNKVQFLIWCVDEDYLIVLEDRNTYYFLITAYCILYDQKREQLEKSYLAYLHKTRLYTKCWGTTNRAFKRNKKMRAYLRRIR